MFIEPRLPTNGWTVPQWVYEIKHDGFRFGTALSVGFVVPAPFGVELPFRPRQGMKEHETKGESQKARKRVARLCHEDWRAL